jgi:hypothetical protein
MSSARVIGAWYRGSGSVVVAPTAGAALAGGQRKLEDAAIDVETPPGTFRIYGRGH